MSTFTPSGSAGGAFACTAGSYAIGRVQVTTAAPSDAVSFRFVVARRGLWFRVGTSAGGQEVSSDVLMGPGTHVVTFTPGVSPYYLEFQLRDEGNAVLSGLTRLAAGVLEIPTVWPLADLQALRSEQSLNTQWWGHGTYAPVVLERRGTSSWSLRSYQPADGPFEPDSASGLTMTPSARTGTATITASGPAFKTTHAGALIRLSQSGQYQAATGTALNAATSSIEVTGQGDARNFYYEVSGTFSATWALQRSVGTMLNWQTVTSGTGAVSTSLNDGLANQIVYYRLVLTAYTSGSAVMSLTYSGGYTDGVARIHAVTADNTVTADVLKPFATTSATAEWAFGSWSDDLGWPTAPALHQGRLHWFRGGRRWASTSDDYESFAAGADDADAISGSVPGPMNAVRWAKSGDRLVFGTAGGEGEVGTGAYDEVMTPDNARAKVPRERGSHLADAAKAFGEPAFVSRSGRRLYLVDASSEKLDAIELSRFHRDIAGTSGVFSQLAWQMEPEPRLWAVRSDGQVAVQLLDLAERIGGFSRLVPAGTAAAIESVCVIPGTPEDHVYLAVKRIVNGSVVRFIEKLAAERWSDSEEAVRLQAAEVYDGASTSTLTGLTHLVGQSVWVWGNGRISGPYTVSAGGAVTVSYPVTYAVVGLKYDGVYVGPRGQPLVDYKRPDHVGLMIHKTAGGAISWGVDLDRMDTLPDREALEAQYNTALPVFSDDRRFPITASSARDQRLHIRFNGVGPATVLGLVVESSK